MWLISHQLHGLIHWVTLPIPFPSSLPAPCRDWHGASLLPGHVILPRDQGREVRQQDQGEEVPAVQSTTAVQDLPQRPEARLLQLRPAANVAVWLPAGSAQLPDSRYCIYTNCINTFIPVLSVCFFNHFISFLQTSPCRWTRPCLCWTEGVDMSFSRPSWGTTTLIHLTDIHYVALSKSL